MHLSVERLRQYYTSLEMRSAAYQPQKIRVFNDHPLLESCLASLIPYFDMQEAFPENIANLKISEAISILRVIDPSIDDMLTNFSDPGKIDLTSFMEKNFMFNMPLEKFGYLTGRSLSTFHRDFKKTYSLPPQKWLLQKRLELAHYLITEKKNRPADVYLEAGFEDLSHFSFCIQKTLRVPACEFIKQYRQLKYLTILCYPSLF